jgi:hypothetical protein
LWRQNVSFGDIHFCQTVWRISHMRNNNTWIIRSRAMETVSEKISFQDAEGNRVSGRFEVSHGMITVTASDGRTRTVEIEESMLGPETLAKVLLLQLHQAGRAAD